MYDSLYNMQLLPLNQYNNVYITTGQHLQEMMCDIRIFILLFLQVDPLCTFASHLSMWNMFGCVATFLTKPMFELGPTEA
jgi:hypothetical protein